MTDHIRIERDGRVLVVTMNRLEKKNALTHAMYAAMADAIEGAQTDDGIRVVLLTGAGEAFTSGNDLVDFQSNPPRGTDTPVARFLRSILNAEKPLMAAVGGVAVGVGTTMLLHCDIVLVSENAMLQTPFVDLALVPEAGSSLLLPQVVGTAIASDMFLTGRRISGEEAVKIGLAARLAPHSELEAEGRRLAHGIAAKAPEAVKLTKGLLRRNREETAARLMLESELFSERLKSPEFMEAATAFMQKRPPNFG
ncbi:enoyl-CoA hydratase-related protein [Sphingosinicella microcystinivorans]|uniref:Enoyl-CoA hydratase n=1 Tax=Sphingosinicella microcystinivorans TaxID=335406 RepID=A0AAD1D9H8_SPHMI|nr:enoyl-CoA hydratase-related protein [Sphingosinicella microcystinivorans]RKS88218.1 enoyl-CoA hydratase [Sphingosinicella microcystinivorans]BBE36030.1 enoyl-CoA hydratase [Sphingosinicella microcystinivorans]